ncbi:MAG: carboxypeptidase regulatory-like domain-containing protein [Acidobacteriota bacterium]
MVSYLKTLRGGLVMMVLVMSSVSPSFGQAADGNLAGVILDPSEAAVAAASVTVENVATGVKTATESDRDGAYRFNHLPVGLYNITASAPGFQRVTLTSIAVELSKTASAHVKLTVGRETESITVTDSASLLDTTTAMIANLSTTRMLTDLPVSANVSGGYQNLSLLGAGVASSGGVGAGTGPSIGGQRPRNNNFTVEGTDINRKDITGPLLSLPTDAVSEFTVLQNQFSAEFGHSAGGQFNTVVRSGTNDVHGKLYEYLQNRYLNAQDAAFKRQGISQRSRYDQSTMGGTIGGPIKRDQLFYFGSFDFTASGRNSTTGQNFYAPTAAGYAALSKDASLSQTNLNVLKKYVGTAPVQDGDYTTAVGAAEIPLGILPISAPAYANVFRGVASLDYNISTHDQLRGRYVQNRSSSIDTQASLPAFWTQRPITAYLASLSEFHTFSPTVMNEIRASYSRYNDQQKAPAFNFPGLDVFPSMAFPFDLGFNLGPYLNAPQSVTQNLYQLANNLTWNKGRHDLKFGFEARSAISSINFISRVRGEYAYSGLEGFLLDETPDLQAVRNVGGKPYLGNAPGYYVYGNDNWKATRHLTLNIGLRWEYNGVSKSMQEQALNSLADVPGVLTFAAPRAQKTNFAPRVGFAYSPGNSGSTSIRGGFGLAYDVIFDNVGNNVRGPQANSSYTANPNSTAPFLASGAIPFTALPPVLTATQARAATTGWLPDQKLGYAVNWNFGIQHAFAKDYVVDIRYVGTRGAHLLLQTMLNRVAQVTPTRSLPLYLTAPTQAELNALPLSLTQLQTGNKFNTLSPYGFTSGITSYGPQGNSIYHGLAIDVTKRFSRQLMFKGGYTWSHLMDDSTAEINTTSLSPRRPQNYQDIRSEWASSALDRRQRLTMTWLWDTPWFRQNHNWFLKNVLGNNSFSGTYTAESPQYVTPQSVADSNVNGDNATDRVVINPDGIVGTGSDYKTLRNSANQIVGYAAVNPNAQYLRAGAGVLTNSGRNTLRTNGINNFDISVGKTFVARERYRTEIRADFYNALNHSQFTPGQINNIASTSHVNQVSYLTPGNQDFGRWDRVFSNNPRYIQLVAKFTF